jgi:transcription elongation factor/antiterminator RfaH
MSQYPVGWYVIYTRHRHEKRLSKMLNAKGIENFLPMATSLRIWSNRKNYVEAPLFPSYLFVYLNNAQEYYAALEPEGALNFVRFGQQLANVSETVINNLRLAAMSDDMLEVSAEQYAPGRKVTVQNGSLAGLSAEIVEVMGKEKFLIRVNLLQRNVLMAIPSQDLISTNHPDAASHHSDLTLLR